MDTNNNVGIGIKELILGVVAVGICLFVKWLVERARGGEAKAKNSQDSVENIQTTSLANRKTASPSVDRVDHEEDSASEGASQEESSKQDLQVENRDTSRESEGRQGATISITVGGPQEGTGVEISGAQIAPNNTRVTSEEQSQIIGESILELAEGLPIVSVSTLKAALESMIFELDGDIMLSIEERHVGDLKKLVDLLEHPDYANKLNEIKTIQFEFCFKKYQDNQEKLKDIQRLMDHFDKFSNLDSISFRNICEELSKEVSNLGQETNVSSITLEKFIHQENLTFCDGKIKLNLKKNILLTGISFTNGTFDDDYVVRVPHPSLELETEPDHGWALNYNLVKSWDLALKDSLDKSYYELPSKQASLEEWLSEKNPQLLEKIKKRESVPCISVDQSKDEKERNNDPKVIDDQGDSYALSLSNKVTKEKKQEIDRLMSVHRNGTSS